MKKFFSLMVSCMIVCSMMAADWSNQLSITAGYWSPTTLFTNSIGNSVINKTKLAGKVRIENPQCYGTYALNYHREIVKWFQIGARVSWEYTGFSIYTTDDPQLAMALGRQHELLGESRSHTILAMVSAQFTYLNTRLVKLYSGIDLGAGVAMWERANMYKGNIVPVNDDARLLKEIQEKYPDAKESHFLPAFNITAIGLNVGTRVYGLAEINIGLDAIAKVGLGVRF